MMQRVKGQELQGNLLLDSLLGADIEIADEADSLNLVPRFEKKAESLREKGYKPYIVEPRGRSVPLLSLGYMNAMLELVGQLAERKIALDYLYLSAANMTQAGLALAARGWGLKIKIMGISPSK